MDAVSLSYSILYPDSCILTFSAPTMNVGQKEVFTSLPQRGLPLHLACLGS